MGGQRSQRAWPCALASSPPPPQRALHQPSPVCSPRFRRRHPHPLRLPPFPAPGPSRAPALSPPHPTLQFTLPFDSTFNCGDKKSTRDKISFQ